MHMLCEKLFNFKYEVKILYQWLCSLKEISEKDHNSKARKDLLEETWLYSYSFLPYALRTTTITFTRIPLERQRQIHEACLMYYHNIFSPYSDFVCLVLPVQCEHLDEELRLG